MVEHVDKHTSTCRVCLRKRPVLVPRIGRWDTAHRYLSPPETYDSIFLKKVKPGTVEHVLSFGSHHLMLICISRHLNAFEKGTSSAFWWTSQCENMLLLPDTWCLLCSVWQVRYRGACMGRWYWAWRSQFMQTETPLKPVPAKSCRTDASLSYLQKRMFWKFLEGERLPSPQPVKSFTLLLDKKEANAIFIKSHTGWFMVRSAGPGQCACGVIKIELGLL